MLEDEVEVSRGNMLVAPDARPEVADQFAANIVWFDEHALLPGRSYILRTETDQASATVTDLKYRVDVNNFAHEAAKSLEMNEVGVCNISTQAPIAFDAFAENRATGAFILIDRITNATVGAGMILHPLRRAANIHWQSLDVDKQARAAQKNQKPAVLWFTGLSGSGKSTIANLLEKKLHRRRAATPTSSTATMSATGSTAISASPTPTASKTSAASPRWRKLMADAGLIVLVSFISPFRAERRMARELMGEGEFVEVFVDTPFEECARRDPKGLYAKALSGEIKNFTGVDSPYEAPEKPEIHLQTLGKSPEEMVELSKPGFASATMPNSNTTAAAASDDQRSSRVFERLALDGRQAGHGRLSRRRSWSTAKSDAVAGDGGRPRQREADPRRAAQRISRHSLRGRGGDRGRHRAVRRSTAPSS